MELVDNKNMYGFKGMKRCEDKKVRNKFVGIAPLKILQLYGINQCKSTVLLGSAELLSANWLHY